MSYELAKIYDLDLLSCPERGPKKEMCGRVAYHTGDHVPFGSQGKLNRTGAWRDGEYLEKPQKTPTVRDWTKYQDSGCRGAVELMFRSFHG